MEEEIPEDDDYEDDEFDGSKSKAGTPAAPAQVRQGYLGLNNRPGIGGLAKKPDSKAPAFL